MTSYAAPTMSYAAPQMSYAAPQMSYVPQAMPQQPYLDAKVIETQKADATQALTNQASQQSSMLKHQCPALVEQDGAVRLQSRGCVCLACGFGMAIAV